MNKQDMHRKTLQLDFKVEYSASVSLLAKEFPIEGASCSATYLR